LELLCLIIQYKYLGRGYWGYTSHSHYTVSDFDTRADTDSHTHTILLNI